MNGQIGYTFLSLSWDNNQLICGFITKHWGYLFFLAIVLTFCCLSTWNVLFWFWVKIIVTQLVKKFSAFYGTWTFITVFTTARHWSLSWARCIQSTPSHPVSLTSHLCLVLQSDLFSLGFRTNFVFISHLSHACYMPRPSRIPWFEYHNNIWRSVHVMKFHVMYFLLYIDLYSQLSCVPFNPVKFIRSRST
jgi:hypothetical protein